MFSIAPISSADSNTKITETWWKVKTNVQNLLSSDIDLSQYAPVLISIAMSKLPEDIKL